MSVQTDTLEQLAAWIEESTGLSDICLDRLPETGGISMEIAAGRNVSEYMDKGAYQRMPLLILVKNENQKTALDAVFDICGAVRRGNNIPASINAVSVASLPELVDNDGKCYIYSLLVNVEFYVGGKDNYD